MLVEYSPSRNCRILRTHIATCSSSLPRGGESFFCAFSKSALERRNVRTVESKSGGKSALASIENEL